MAEIKLEAHKRVDFGKGAARKIRQKDLVPAVLYGKGSDPIHVTLPEHETALALRQANVLLRVKVIDGEEGLAIPKQVQRHPVSNRLQHIDLLIVKAGQKVEVEVPIVIVGDVEPGGVLIQEHVSLLVSAEATSIPTEVQIDVDGLKIGEVIAAGDIKLPVGVEALLDAEELLITVNAPRVEAASTEESETAEATTEDSKEE